ncbi:hypothetical protein BGZ95_001986 [Linnemannia exigua]|uniref:Uncharacterized protein n=1 Tax=Linnemannia exigua TaxID=604196 RepID=A0AAD4DIZ0_9FUNG|nr:hypothetical protein BGZ95_001986 [Linnemannia exigua]
MHSANHAALELPEIIARVGSFLTRRSTVVCLQVNSSFHSILAPLIYRNLHIFSNRGLKRPSTQALIRYAYLVHSLSVHSFVSLTYLTAGYRNLHSLSFSSYRGNSSRQVGTDDEIFDTLLRLIQDNPGLRMWRLDDPWPQFSEVIWKAIAERTTELDELVIRKTTIDEYSRPWFQRVCQKAKHIGLVEITMLGSGSSESLSRATGVNSPSSQLDLLQSPSQSFASRSVRFNEVQGMSMLDQLEFLSRCPNLQELFWKPPREHSLATASTITNQELFPELADFQRLLQPTTWPSLTSVNIEEDNATRRLTDGCLEHILESIPAGTLKELICKGSLLGYLGMGSLTTRHFSSLSELNGAGCTGIKSPMVQRLLESCPQLSRIDVTELHIRDLQKGQPWVCTRLTNLYVQFNLRLEQGDLGWQDYSEPLTKGNQDALETTRFIQDQQHVFGRLAGLTALKALDVQVLQRGFNGVISLEGSILHNGLLDFRVSRGLKMLSPLKHLRYLDVSQTCQQLGKEDIEIMVAQWPLIAVLRGTLNPDEQVDAALGDYLEERRIHRLGTGDF